MKNRGFTLIELLVAITILAIISTIGITMYSNVQRQARDGKRIADIQEIQKALEQHYTLNKDYPAKLYGTDAETGNIKNAFQNNKPPADPSRDDDSDGTTDNYSYIRCASPYKYIACAHLEGNGGNRDAAATDACSDNVTNTGNTWYCAGAMSN